MPGFEIIGNEERDAVNDIFDTGGVLYRYGLDARRQHIFRVNEFEKKIAEQVGVTYCHCVCNGTAALKIGLVGLGVKPGDEVITQSFTFIATVEAILEIGAIPVITEVDKSLNMDPVDLAQKITPKTKAIIPVHMAGVPAKMDEIMAVAQKYNVPVFEDSAQAFGATYKGKNLGTIGRAGIYSFDIGKVITTGEGGALVTNDEQLYRRAREYADHGHEQNPTVPRGEDTRTIWGFNYKITELQGAVGLAQIQKLEKILSIQRKHKAILKQALQHISNIEFREIPDALGDAGDTLIFFVQSHEHASRVAKALAQKGIGTKNLPDAIDWHFAGTWGHIFSAYQEYRGRDLAHMWQRSAELLRRAVAIPIMIGKSEAEIIQLGADITQALNESL